MTTKLNVVCPVFNEEAVIEQFHTRTSRVLDGIPNVDSKIIYVVDKCTDNTVEILRSIAKTDPRTTVLALSSRFGHQMSLLAGIERSLDVDAIIMMDSDLQHPPELIPELLRRFDDGADVVFTTRTDNQDVRTVRKMVGSVFYRLLNRISEIPINPNSADFRLISRRVANALSNGFAERNMFLRGLFSWMGFNQVGVDFVAERRASGESKYSLSQMMRLALTGILSSSTKPLHIGIFAGALFGIIAFVLMFATVVNFFIDRSLPSGWTSMVTLLLLFSAIQLMVMGVIGIYLGGIYEEVKSRPRYIVQEEISFHE